MGLFSSSDDFDEEACKAYIAEDAGPTVTPKRINTIDEMLKTGEKVVHILRVPTLSHGTSDADQNKSQSTTTKTGTAAFTKDRIVIKIPHMTADDQFTLRYNRIQSVAYNVEGLFGHRQFTITTAQEKYRMGVHVKIDDEEVREIVDWVDAKAASSSQGGKDDARTPTERLEELQSLKEKGLVTEEEFESKRSEIIDEM